VLVDQFIDRTFARAKAFFEPGCVAHVSMADPVSPALVDQIEAAAKALEIPYTRGGTYIVIEGPQFSTRAESNLYRSWGCDVIGMTNMPEAKLAREAEICYATIAMVTDYDCWHAEHSEVDVAAIIKVLMANVDHYTLIEKLAPRLPALTPAPADSFRPRPRRRHHHRPRRDRGCSARRGNIGPCSAPSSGCLADVIPTKVGIHASMLVEFRYP
jgi:5'-methylthioadenosine phosphorylase